MRRVFAALIVIAALMATSAVLAQGRPFQLPSHAQEVAPGIFYLGAGRDIDGRLVEGLAFVRKAPEFRSNGMGQGMGGGGGGGGCFAVLARDAAWIVTEPYRIDPTVVNNANLSSSDIRSETALALQAWNSAADFLVFGSEEAGAVDGADEVSPDGLNEVLFAPISGSGTIAVTITWGIFSGPPSGRELVEWDTVFDDDGDWLWGNAGPTDENGCNPSVCDDTIMDFRSIAQHEYGHAAGLGHPGSSCTEETMFAFATEGETKKRTLNAGDIAGMVDLYQ
ncbi:MAG TPA: matrixin family metalloprotease [Acidobacteriota bacterium]|nr:matrixin family metalloprotease [Acidobacteriota bacterium]